jgi:hypothetical protein
MTPQSLAVWNNEIMGTNLFIPKKTKSRTALSMSKQWTTLATRLTVSTVPMAFRHPVTRILARVY